MHLVVIYHLQIHFSHPPSPHPFQCWRLATRHQVFVDPTLSWGNGGCYSFQIIWNYSSCPIVSGKDCSLFKSFVEMEGIKRILHGSAKIWLFIFEWWKQYLDKGKSALAEHVHVTPNTRLCGKTLKWLSQTITFSDIITFHTFATLNKKNIYCICRLRINYWTDADSTQSFVTLLHNILQEYNNNCSEKNCDLHVVELGKILAENVGILAC
jgi:hypothetical protein